MSTVLITTSTFGEYSKEPIELLEKLGIKVIKNPLGRTLAENEVKGLLNDHKPVGLIAGIEPLTASVLANAKSLKVISRCGVGVNNIDIKAADTAGIKIFNTPDALTESVAELTIGLMLSIIRRICEADRNIRAGKWKKLMGRSLKEMTVGIIGCGRIGSCVAEYLKPFGCKIVGYDPVVPSHNVIETIPLKKLIQKSDLITLHVPLNKDTNNIVNDIFIQKMKQDSFIVNVSRGEIIEEPSLLKGLNSGKIAGAALDTFAKEPYSGLLLNYDNVILTVHMGSYSKMARIKMEVQSVQNLLKGLEGLK